MRFFSKTSAGVAALAAGLIVWSTGQVAALFWAAMVPTLMGVAFVAISGDRRGRALARPCKGAASDEAPSLRGALSRGSVWALIVPSLLFESQIKLAIAYLSLRSQRGARRLALRSSAAWAPWWSEDTWP